MQPTPEVHQPETLIVEHSSLPSRSFSTASRSPAIKPGSAGLSSSHASASPAIAETGPSEPFPTPDPDSSLPFGPQSSGLAARRGKVRLTLNLGNAAPAPPYPSPASRRSPPTTSRSPTSVSFARSSTPLPQYSPRRGRSRASSASSSVNNRESHSRSHSCSKVPKKKRSHRSRKRTGTQPGDDASQAPAVTQRSVEGSVVSHCPSPTSTRHSDASLPPPYSPVTSEFGNKKSSRPAQPASPRARKSNGYSTQSSHTGVRPLLLPQKPSSPRSHRTSLSRRGSRRSRTSSASHSASCHSHRRSRPERSGRSKASRVSVKGHQMDDIIALLNQTGILSTHAATDSSTSASTTDVTSLVSSSEDESRRHCDSGERQIRNMLMLLTKEKPLSRRAVDWRDDILSVYGL